MFTLKPCHARAARFAGAAFMSTLCLAAATFEAKAAPTVFTAAGADPASIQASVDAFRTALGANNGNVAGFQDGGRREVNWDGGGAAAPATLFPNPMLTFGFRGNVNTTPGTALEISGAPSPNFAEINASYGTEFKAFSAPRLFAPIGSNVTDVFFTEPGDTDIVATSNGFGVVFTDVDLGFTTSVEFFNLSGTSLGTLFAEVFDKGLSFVGAIFGDAVIGRVRIITGNTALGPNDGGGIDVVAMDDFLYGEPVGVPEPGMLALFSLAAAGLVVTRTRRREGRTV